MDKTILKILVVAIIAGGLGFYGGMQYSKGSNSKANLGNNFQNFQGRRNSQQGINNGVIGGQIIKIDDKSATIQLRNGGSKIIFFSDTTKIMKSVDGALKDLVAGEEITANGIANQDGSITAQSIQLRAASQQNR